MANSKPVTGIDMVMISADGDTLSLATLPKRQFVVKLATIVTIWQVLHGNPDKDGLTFIISAIENDIRNWKDERQDQVTK